jgi:hypothetical protein
MIVHGFTISAFGRLASRHRIETAKLARGAVDYLTSVLESHGNEFQVQIPLRGCGHIDLHWQSEHFSCALANFLSEGQLLATAVVVSGMRPQADQKVLRMGQTALENVCSAAGQAGPADELEHIQARPALASIHWSGEDRRKMELLGDVEICLAAAFLERSFRAGELAP